MRYFRVRTDSDDPRPVARDGRTAYALSSARPALSSFRDRAMVASTTDRGDDDVAEALLDDAPVVGEAVLEPGAIRPAVPDEVWTAGVTCEAGGDAREDSEWDAPEPELGLVPYGGDVVGYTVGDDVSGRDIEGQNPLYLRQTNVFERCCPVGPRVASPETVEDLHELETSTTSRDGEATFEGGANTSLMARTCEERRADDRAETTIANAGTPTNTVTTV